jgi:hypothetical protein
MRCPPRRAQLRTQLPRAPSGWGSSCQRTPPGVTPLPFQKTRQGVPGPGRSVRVRGTPSTVSCNGENTHKRPHGLLRQRRSQRRKVGFRHWRVSRSSHWPRWSRGRRHLRRNRRVDSPGHIQVTLRPTRRSYGLGRESGTVDPDTRFSGEQGKRGKRTTTGEGNAGRSNSLEEVPLVDRRCRREPVSPKTQYRVQIWRQSVRLPEVRQ